MAARLSAQLEGLQQERERLEELLLLDANWRALRQLEAREAAGEPVQAVNGADLKASLEAALRANRVYVARARLVETIELLKADFPARSPLASGGSLASRIVMLSEPEGETFRARLRVKPGRDAVPAAEPCNRDVNEVAAAAVEVKPAPPVAPTVAPPAASPAPSPAVVSEAVAADALELIDGLGRQAVEQLLDGGVTRFKDIAGWSSFDVGAWRARLDGIAQGTPGLWIEQAAVLAAGRQTSYARRARSGEFAALVAPPDPEPPRPWLSGEAPAKAAEVPACSSAPASAPDSVPAALPVAVPAPAPAPVCVPEATAVSPPAAKCPPLPAVRGVTAEELAEALSQTPASDPAKPPPLPDAVDGAVRIAPTVELDVETPRSAAVAAKAGYVRPRHRPTAAVVTRPDLHEERREARPEPRREAAEACGAPGEPATLMRRLKSLHQSDRFEAAAYAAYRGNVEEASVSILSGDGRDARKAEPAGSGEAATARPVSRFLKALTGKA